MEICGVYQKEFLRDQEGMVCEAALYFREKFSGRRDVSDYAGIQWLCSKNGRKRVIKETSTALKGHPISFTVDRTPPVVQIGGLEEEYYEEEKHPFVITVMDNCEFAYMDLNIRYEELDVQYGNEERRAGSVTGKKAQGRADHSDHAGGS